MARRFEEEFTVLNDALREMGALVAQSVHRGVRSLVEKNQDYASQVLRDEARIDQMEIRIDDLATSLIVREQPVASDMRFVVAAIKINTDLERMGDMAVSIVERSLALMGRPAMPNPVNFDRIASLVESMVLGSLDAFTRRDPDLAREILTSDDAVDAERNQIRRHLVALMQQDPASIELALDYLVVARSLERIADHATNIAEDIIFLAQGIDVRHQTLPSVTG